MEVSDTQIIIADTAGKIAAVSALPIPFMDVAAMTYFQYRMVNDLAELHDVPVDDNTNLIISSILSSLVAKLIT